MDVLKDCIKRVVEQIGQLKGRVEITKEQMDNIKMKNEVMKTEVESMDVVRKLDSMTETIEDKSRRLVELVEVIETLLRMVHAPPSLVDLAVGRVVEEGLGVGEIPTTLRVKVAGLQKERMERVNKILDKIESTQNHIDTVFEDVIQAVPLITAELAQLWGQLPRH